MHSGSLEHFMRGLLKKVIYIQGLSLMHLVLPH